MSAATSFSPPPAQLLSGGELLSVHTLTDPMNSQQSLPSAVESIDEVQLGLDIQADEESNEDGQESDQLDADPTTIPSVATDDHTSIGVLSDDQVPHEQVFEYLEVLDPAYEQAIGTDAIDTSSAPLALESNTTQADGASDTFISNTTHTTILSSASIVSAPVDDTIDQEGSESANPVETAVLEAPLLDEHDIAALAQDLAPQLEAEAEANLFQDNFAQNNAEDELNYPSRTFPALESDVLMAQSAAPEVHEGEEMSDLGVEPLRRTDNEIIPVTEQSENAIIGILDDAPMASVDETIQSVTAQEEVMAEGGSITDVSNSAQEPSQGGATSDHPEEQMPVEMIAHLDPIQAAGATQEPITEVDEDATMQPEHTQDMEGDDAEMDELASTVGQEPTSAVDIERTIVVETNEPVLDDTDYVLIDAIEAEATTTIEQVTTTVQATAAEDVEPAFESDGPEATRVPEITVTDTDITTTAITTTTIPTETASTDQFASSPEDEETTETGRIHRAAQIQQEQDATAEIPVDKGPDVPTCDISPTMGVAPSEEVLPTPDEAAPKDSGEPLRARPETGLEPTEIEPVVETVVSLDPAITQNEKASVFEPTESLVESTPQHETLEQEPLTEEVSNRFTPDWDGLASADEDEDAPGSSEVVNLSSKASQPPDSAVASPTTNPVNNSAGEAPDADLAKDDLPAPTTSRKSNQKRRMIMEVVIPIPSIKSETIKRETARGRSKSKPQARVPLSNPSKAEPSSGRRPRSASASTTETPLPSEDEGNGGSPARPTSHPRQQKRDPKRPFGSRKRTPKKPGEKHTPIVHAARSLKVEVVMSKAAKPRQSLLRRTGSIPSGNNVKFAPISPVTGKRKAEAEPEPEPKEQLQTEEVGSDVDAEGSDDEGYEDIEDVEVKVEVPNRRPRKPKASAVKRPRRSNEARKMPAKLPEVLTGSRSPAAKRRRLRR